MTMTMPKTTTTLLASASTKLDEAFELLTDIDLREARGNAALREFVIEARDRCSDTRAAVLDALAADAPRN